MGTDYSASLAIGYEFEADDFKRFKATVDPEWRMEPRWDPKTGKKLPDERVELTTGGEVYRFDGNDYDFLEEMVEAIAEKVGACLDTNGEGYSDPDYQTYIIGLKLKNVGGYKGTDIGCLSCYGKVDWQDVVAAGEELNRIGQELLKLGVLRYKHQEKAVVMVVGSEC